MKKFSFLIVVLTAALLLASPIANSSSIVVSPPVMLDTSAAYQATGGPDKVWPIYQALVARGENVDLVLVSATSNPTTWSMIRLTRAGDIIDTMTLGVPGSKMSDTTFLFIPFAVHWKAQLFVILGTYHKKSGGPDSTAWVRVDESGHVLDAKPHAIDGGLFGTFSTAVSGHYLWIVRPDYNGTILVRMYDLESGQALMRDSILTDRAGSQAVVAADSTGIWVTAFSNSHTALYCFRVSTARQIMLLDSIPFSHSYARLTGFGSDVLSGDSALACFLDTTSSGTTLLRYCRIPHDVPTMPVTLDSILIPSYSGGRFYRETSYQLAGQSLRGVATAFSFGSIDAVSFDLNAGTCTYVDRLPIEPTENGPLLVAFFCEGTKALAYHRSRAGLFNSRWDWGDPSGSLVREPALLRGEPLRCPSIISDSAGVLVYAEVCRYGNQHLRGYRISDAANRAVTDRFDIMVGGKPHFPTLLHMGEEKGLMWNEDITDSIKLENSDSTAQHRLLGFFGDAPTSQEIQSARRLGRSYRNYSFRPQVAVRDSFLYVANIYFPWFDGYDDSVMSYLAIINTNSSDSVTYISKHSNGQPVLVPHLSAVDWVGSWIYCSSYSHIACLTFNGGYNVISMVGTTVTSSSGIPQGSGSLSGLPSDVAVTGTDSGQVLVMSKDARVFRYEEKWNGYFLVADLSTFLPSVRFHDAKLYPVQAGSTNCVVAITSDKTSLLLMTFDPAWNFLDSTAVSLIGAPMDFSEFVYDERSRSVVFAYTGFVASPHAAPQLFFQSIKIEDITDVGGGGTSPDRFTLSQNYPNPFNGGTTVRYNLPSRSNVDLDIFNVLGQRVWSKHVEGVASGSHEIVWDGRTGSGKEVASGVYFYRLTAGTMVASKKMLLLK